MGQCSAQGGEQQPIMCSPVGATMLDCAGGLAFDKMHQQDVSKHVLPFMFAKPLLTDVC